MSDIKFCPSCGASLSAAARFCHKCGQKQEIVPSAEPSPVENLNSVDGGQVVAEEVQKVEDTAPAEPIETAEQTVEGKAAEEKAVEEKTVEEVKPEAQVESISEPQPEIKEEAPAPSPSFTAPQTPPVTPASPASEAPRPAVPAYAPQAPQNTAQIPQQNMYQQSYYPQAPMPRQEAQAPKKKFPWFFAIFWLIMFLAVVGWGVYLYMLRSNDYDFPQFTEDAKRIVLFVSAIGVLIYTLSMKLTMKKFKVFPTIVLVLSALVVFYLFCMWELTDGDMLHDAISDLTENILPVSGD